jgi:hypothetical protein
MNNALPIQLRTIATERYGALSSTERDACAHAADQLILFNAMLNEAAHVIYHHAVWPHHADSWESTCSHELVRFIERAIDTEPTSVGDPTPNPPRTP